MIYFCRSSDNAYFVVLRFFLSTMVKEVSLFEFGCNGASPRNVKNITDIKNSLLIIQMDTIQSMVDYIRSVQI